MVEGNACSATGADVGPMEAAEAAAGPVMVSHRLRAWACRMATIARSWFLLSYTGYRHSALPQLIIRATIIHIQRM